MSRLLTPFDPRPRSGPYAGLTLNSARRFLAKQFEHAELNDCEAEARDLIMAATAFKREELITRGTESLSPEAFNLIEEYSKRRLSGEPIDHILGWREFYGRRFKVTSDVLSPRQETEEVLAKALELITNVKSPDILDLGTGSGAIAVTLLAERLDAAATAVDISEAALLIAKTNAAAHDVQARLTVTLSDWFEALQGKFDLIISNPPYIDSKAMTELPIEVSKFDPALALHGGTDGLAPYRLIASAAKTYLKDDGYLVFEIGYDQDETVPNILKLNGFEHISLHADIFGRPRIVTAKV